MTSYRSPGEEQDKDQEQEQPQCIHHLTSTIKFLALNRESDDSGIGQQTTHDLPFYQLQDTV